MLRFTTSASSSSAKVMTLSMRLSNCSSTTKGALTSSLLLHPVLVRHSRRYLSTATSSSTQSSKRSIPMPKGRYPLLGHLPRMLRKESIELWDTFHSETGGDIFRVDTGFGNSLVVTKSTKHAQMIMAHQGRDSFRTPTISWDAVHRKMKWPNPGIPWARGDDHRRKRQVLAETLLMQKNAKQYVPLVVPKANRFVDCLAAHLNENHRLVDPVSITQLTGMYALEAVMKVVVGVDFPALEHPLPQPAVDFVESVKTMFTETAKVDLFPPLHIRFETPTFQRLVKAWETMVKYPLQTVKPVLDYYQQNNKQLPDHVQGTVLVKLMEQHEAGSLSLDEVWHTGVQAIAAAVDTTAQTMEYLLYNLARNPDVQEKLYQQSLLLLDSSSPLRLSIEEYEEQKYLFAVLKESMRITPTVGVHARTLTQDADLGDGYVIPKDQLVLINYLAMTTNEELYPSPDLFLPERFLREQQPRESSSPSSSSLNQCPFRPADKQAAIDRGDATHKRSPYAAIPFGHGSRKCAGKAFAELDIHLATMALLRKYRIEYDGPPLQQREESLLRPVQPMSPHFSFVPRN